MKYISLFLALILISISFTGSSQVTVHSGFKSGNELSYEHFKIMDKLSKHRESKNSRLKRIFFITLAVLFVVGFVSFFVYCFYKVNKATEEIMSKTKKVLNRAEQSIEGLYGHLDTMAHDLIGRLGVEKSRDIIQDLREKLKKFIEESTHSIVGGLRTFKNDYNANIVPCLREIQYIIDGIKKIQTNAAESNATSGTIFDQIKAVVPEVKDVLMQVKNIKDESHAFISENDVERFTNIKKGFEDLIKAVDTSESVKTFIRNLESIRPNA